MPGDESRAPDGVLCLDVAPACRRDVVEGLHQPRESPWHAANVPAALALHARAPISVRAVARWTRSGPPRRRPCSPQWLPRLRPMAVPLARAPRVTPATGPSGRTAWSFTTTHRMVYGRTAGRRGAAGRDHLGPRIGCTRPSAHARRSSPAREGRWADGRRGTVERPGPRGRGRKPRRRPWWRFDETCPVQRGISDGAAEMVDGTGRGTHRGGHRGRLGG